MRKYTFYSALDYIENLDGVLESRSRTAKFQTDLQNADGFAVTYTNQFERLPRPFRIASNVTLPVGGYGFDNVRAEYTGDTGYAGSSTDGSTIHVLGVPTVTTGPR